ncbi:MAG TPA: DoxX family protein [Acidobacteriaceae bacterium]|nr:DoxX family protein [Acidobacteriaceae bacterium]
MRLYARFVRAMRWLESPLLLAIRLYWGWQFAQSGWGKLHRLDQVADFFATLNLPAPHFTALFCATLEFVGGILLALGLGSRFISLVLFINMTMAYWTADREAFGQIFSNPDKFTGADPYTFWFAALLILILGPGMLALDTLLRRKFGAPAEI